MKDMLEKLYKFFVDLVYIFSAFIFMNLIFNYWGLLSNADVNYLFIIGGYLFISLNVMLVYNLFKTNKKYFQAREYLEMIVITSYLIVSSIICYLIILSLKLTLLYILSIILVFIMFDRFVNLLFKFYYYIKEIKGKQNKFSKRTLIIGAGEAGSLVYNHLKNNYSTSHLPVAFIDDDPTKIGSKLEGLDIFGPLSNIRHIVKYNYIDEVVIAIKELSLEKTQFIINKISRSNVSIKIIELMFGNNGDDMLRSLRKVNIESLLGRAPIDFEQDGIDNLLTDKVVLVTGAGGSIGSELCRRIIEFKPKQIIMIDIYENNVYDLKYEIEEFLKINNQTTDVRVLISSVRDLYRMQAIFRQYKPQIVFHAAAHKHVPLMEYSAADAINNNIFGTYNVVSASHDNNVEKFVLISTDKAVNPSNVMGATKRFSELLVTAYDYISNTDYTAVRFGNVLGSNGSVIPRFRKQVEAGGPVSVTDERMTRYFMTIPEACKLVLQSGAFANGGEVFVLDMGDPISIINLAKNLIRLYGFEPDEDIKIKITGIRPGESLHEELLVNPEVHSKTKNEKIFVEKIDLISLEEIKLMIERLKIIIRESDNKQIKKELLEMLENYRYN